MFDYQQLRALSAVHRLGSFDRAANALSVTPSAISQRIKALEDRIGTLLIRRGSPAIATKAGLKLIHHLDVVALLEKSVDLADPSPAKLRLAVNADSLATWVIPALAEHTDFQFDLVIDDQDVSQDWLIKGEVQAAITSHPGPLQGCDTLALGALPYVATASPDFVARWFPKAMTKDAIALAPSLVFSSHDMLQQRWITSMDLVPDHGFSPPLHVIPSSQGFVDACLRGLGWGMNPTALARPLLASGQLVELAVNRELCVPLYWQFARATAKALAPLTQSMQRHAATALYPISPR